jgi:molybdate transport system ATP-binding protein
VLLARALAWRPGLLLMDELLNGLDAENRQRVLRLIAQLSRRRMPWVLSTHRIEDVPPQATHVAILENGRLVRQGRIAQLLGARWRQRAPAIRRAPQHRQRASAAAVLVLRNAWVWLEGRAVLKRLGFTIREHECWVIHGPNGAGKSTLIRALYGDLGVASQGELRRRGIEAGVPIAEVTRRVGLVAPELQTQHPLYLRVLEVVVSGLHSSVGLDVPPSAAERRRALAALRSVGAARLAGRPLRELSYGQQRRVLFARALVHRPDILLLDEPYTGLDAATRAALQRRIERAGAGGTTIIMTTHHRNEWPAHTTHELQLDSGESLYCGQRRRDP